MTANQSDKHVLENIKTNISTIRENVFKAAYESNRDPRDIQIMAVTKTVPSKYVNFAIDCNIDLLGENRSQELNEKFSYYKLKEENIHFIGHLQKNKIRQVIDKVSMIESVDSFSLAQNINKVLIKQNKKLDILIEVNIGSEDTKFGFPVNSLKQDIKRFEQLNMIRVKGLMCIPKKLKSDYYFKKIYNLYLDICELKYDNIDMTHLSMGMSCDYESAIKNGATIIRIGSAIFGKRQS